MGASVGEKERSGGWGGGRIGGDQRRGGRLERRATKPLFRLKSWDGRAWWVAARIAERMLATGENQREVSVEAPVVTKQQGGADLCLTKP